MSGRPPTTQLVPRNTLAPSKGGRERWTMDVCNFPTPVSRPKHQNATVIEEGEHCAQSQNHAVGGPKPKRYN